MFTVAAVCAYLATLDKSKVHDVPSTLIAKFTLQQQAAIKRCAKRQRIIYRIVP